MSFDAQMLRLDSVAQINPKRKVSKGDSVPFVDMAALLQHSRDISSGEVITREAKGAGAHFQNGDTLLARITPCLENGKTAQVRCLNGGAVGEGSTEFIVLCGIDPADNDFVYYLCRDPAFREYAIGRMEGTSGRQRVSWQTIAAYEFICLGPLERRAAAQVFSALDDRITLLRETNATLEAIAQALFKSWFVDFDPVRAKMQGRAPEGMDEATAALFPDGLEESELGLVPRGWRIGTLADLSDLNPESWSAKNHPDVVAYIDLANAKDNEIASVTDFTFANAPSRARRVLRGGDTIVGTVRPGNRSFAFIHEPASNLTASTGFAVLRPSAVANTEFVYLAATQDSSIEHLAHVADGGAYPAVRPDVVSGLQSLVPAAFVLEAFHVAAAPLLAKVAENQAQAQTLATLRDTLLPRLISGALRLPQAEAMLEVAA